MRAYLVRHGVALDADVDPDRPLSEDGRADVQAVAAVFARAGESVDRIAHSGALRARQTAEILADAMGMDAFAVDGLAPNDPVESWLGELNEETGDIMLVGHMPFLGRLAGALLTGSEATEVVHFATATAACLERRGERWSVAWVLPPALAR